MGSLLIQETSTLALVSEKLVDRSWETLWISESIHRSLISTTYSSYPTPFLIVLHAHFNFMRVHVFLMPHSEIPEDGQRLGNQSLTGGRGTGGGMVEAAGFPQPLHTGRGPVGSANWLYQVKKH